MYVYLNNANQEEQRQKFFLADAAKEKSLPTSMIVDRNWLNVAFTLYIFILYAYTEKNVVNPNFTFNLNIFC